MDDIWTKIASIGMSLHPDKILSITKVIGNVDGPEGPIDLSDFTNVEKQKIKELLKHWGKHSHISKDRLIGCLIGSMQTTKIHTDNEKLEVVWTGPNSAFVPTRSTKQVMIESIRSAKTEITIMSYSVYDVDSIIHELLLASNRGVRIKVILERSIDVGGKLKVDAFEPFKKKLPKAVLLTWIPDDLNGSVHGKALIVDREIAFVTSANLTGSAIEKNMELGIKITGGKIPSKLGQHFSSLIEQGIITINKEK